MVACVDAQRETYGVESICQYLPIAPSTYWRHKAQQADATRRSSRAQCDEILKTAMTRVWHEQEQVYGAEKVWRQLLREGWGPGYVAETHYLRVYVAGLRRKLEADPSRPRHLLTEPGMGYRFVP